MPPITAELFAGVKDRPQLWVDLRLKQGAVIDALQTQVAKLTAKACELEAKLAWR